MNMREKIAVALFKTDYPKDDWARLDVGRGSYNQDRYRAKADAVLDALMEPTKEMILAGEVVIDDALDSDTSSSWSGGEHWADEYYSIRPGTETAAYIAMVRAAKEGK